MCFQPSSLPVVSLPPAPGCLSFPIRTWGRSILADGSCTDANAPCQVVSSSTVTVVSTRVCSAGGCGHSSTRKALAKRAGRGPCTGPHPGLTPQEGTNPPASPTAPCSPMGERIWPQDSCRAELVALTFEWPSRRSLWKTWQNFQQSTALPDSGSRFTTDQKVCAPFS